MKTLVLQNLTHRGTVSAAGLLFSAALLPELEIRRRILSLWQTEAKVFRSENEFILLLPREIRIDCRYALGLPLVRCGQILSAFPLKKKDLEYFDDSGEIIIYSAAGSIETLFPTALEPVAVETWFDLSSFQPVETETLGEVNRKPVIVEKVENIDLREELKEVPKADEKLAEILQVLQQKKAELDRAESRGSANFGYSHGSGGGSGSLLKDIVSGAGSGLLGALRSLFSKIDSQLDDKDFDYRPKPPGRLRKALTKMLFQMKVAQLVGREQAKYLAKMMELFERGDLDEALKHAIPLQDMQALKEMTEQMPFLGFLRPRRDLRINYNRQRDSNSGVHLDAQWFNDLRELYRQTFDRLVAQNRIEEAAFVLAELLKSNHEAVEFLEKHGKYRLAAELAEARNLSKEIIVRQWYLAGEIRKAVQLAILHNCFEYVVSQLEKQNHPGAVELREIWAETLARSGNYSAAVNTIWPLTERREKAKDWLDQVIEFGGVPAAQMLAKKTALFPAAFADIKLKMQEILAENTDEAKEKRAAFAHETLRLSPNPELRTLARPLIRKLLSDISGGSYIFTPNDLKRMVDFAQDFALRTDLPKVPPSAVRKTVEPLKLDIAANDKGSTQVLDACLLPDGKVAVALGEAGVKLISKQGKTIAHFDQPTEKFIVSDFGTRAICLARRGEVRRFARIDFVTRRADYWCDAVIDNFAPTFDGNLWFIGLNDEIHAIDTNAKNFESVWRVPEIGGELNEIKRSKSKLMLLIWTAKGFEKWWYELPALTLRSRNEPKWLQMDNDNQGIYFLSSFVAYTIVQIRETVDEINKFSVKIFDYDTRIGTIDFPEGIIELNSPQMIENKYVVSYRTENGLVVALYETPNREIASIFLADNFKAAIRLDEKLLTVTDDFGRVIIFDHQEKALRKNIRL